MFSPYPLTSPPFFNNFNQPQHPILHITHQLTQNNTNTLNNPTLLIHYLTNSITACALRRTLSMLSLIARPLPPHFLLLLALRHRDA